MGGGSEFWELLVGRKCRSAENTTAEDPACGILGHECRLPGTAGEAGSASESDEAAAAAGAEDAGTIGCNCGDRYCTPQQVAAFVKGKRLAVDLSCWVVQCDNTQGAAGAPPEFRQTLYLRNIFYRALRISSTKYGGALPIFVSDPLIGSQVI